MNTILRDQCSVWRDADLSCHGINSINITAWEIWGAHFSADILRLVISACYRLMARYNILGYPKNNACLKFPLSNMSKLLVVECFRNFSIVYYYEQTLLSDGQIKFSICPKHFKHLFKFFFGFGIIVIRLNQIKYSSILEEWSLRTFTDAIWPLWSRYLFSFFNLIHYFPVLVFLQLFPKFDLVRNNGTKNKYQK